MELIKLKGFKKEEKKIVVYVFLFVIVLSLLNFRIALRKARDFQRKADINRVVNALEVYHDEFAFFPPSSEDGKIVACKKGGTTIEDLLVADRTLTIEEQLLDYFEECEWGKDPLRDISDPDYPAYLESLPEDPDTAEGVDYYYISNIGRFQLYAALEGKSEPEYREGIETRGVNCGKKVCNFGKTLGGTPLEMSLEDFERIRMESE